MHLFEPNEKLLSFTQVKYEYKENVFFHNVGLLNEDTAKEFFFFENFNNELSSFYKGGKEWNGLPMISKKIDVRRGDYVCEQLRVDKIDFLKIDCEGSDFETLCGFEAKLAADKIGIIQIEYSEHWVRAGRTFDNLKYISDKYGYKIYRYIENNFWEVKEDNPPYDNYFITKFEIHNYCIAGSNANFIMNSSLLPKQDLVIEVGSHEGLTAKYICENLLNMENPDARLICVDPMFDYYVVDDPRYHPEFKHQYPRFKRNTRGFPVELKRGLSQDELPKLNALRASLCYIDGNHYSPMPYLDGVWCFAITKIGGHVIFDDYLWCDDTQESIDKFLNEFQGHYELIERNYQIVIRKTSNHYTELTQPFYL
jgi:FkbM family methyltransferase